MKITSCLFDVENPDFFSLELPANAQVLSATIEGSHQKARMWVALDPDAEMTKREFICVTTSRRMDAEVPAVGLCFICSFVSATGLVFHLFEKYELIINSGVNYGIGIDKMLSEPKPIKTNFDEYLEEQMQDPEFAREFKDAGVEIDKALVKKPKRAPKQVGAD